MKIWKGIFLEVSECRNGFNLLGSIKVSNTTKLGLVATLSDYADRDKLPNGVSTMLSKSFKVSVRTGRAVRRRFVDYMMEYAIQQQIMRVEKVAKYADEEMKGGSRKSVIRGSKRMQHLNYH